GNIIWVNHEGGGEYVENGSEKWIWNSKNKVLEDNQYNSCNSDVPENSTKTIYYPDNITPKEISTRGNQYDSKSTSYFFEDSKKKEEIIINGSIYQTKYEYEK
ncbi:MAG TPA: hypothetical protein VNY36_08090, partial [Bacteroidia bacterium]|nr:hypothetical protein [Bacteroidia bacterium]